jgi:hypothetical protein
MSENVKSTWWKRVNVWADSIWVWRSMLLLGFILRLRQYLGNRSLWGDEASLSMNLVTRSFSGLTEPLGYHQAAPLGFLFIEKLSIVLLWNADYILRLFPFISGILALYFMYRIARENFGAAGMFALLMFVINPFMIFYSSELKQYSSDVMSALMLAYLGTRCMKDDAKRGDFILLGAAGAVMIWISHISIFVLAAVGVTLVLERLLQKKYENLAWIFSLGAVWLASFGLDYFFVLRHTAGDEYFLTYWARRFVPILPWSDPDWFRQTAYLFLYTIVNRTDRLMMRIVSALMLVGVISLSIRKRHVTLVLSLTLLVTLVASALKSYPLAYRFMLFLTPYALLFMAEGIGAAYSLLAKWHRGIALALSLIPAAFFLSNAIPNAVYNFQQTQTISEIRPVVEYVAENKKNDDRVYVYYGGVPGVMYYAPQYSWEIDPNFVMLGSYRQNEEKAFKKFFEDMEALKGHDRVWFIFNEITGCGGCEGDSRAYFRDYIAQYGTLLDEFLDVESAAYLFDLKK